MKRLNKTLRRKLQRRQRSRRWRLRRRQTRRLKGGGLPVPAGSLVAISTAGEYGIPILVSKEKAEELQEKGGLED